MSESIAMPEDVKNCQFCGEEVLAVAKKCKHCASMLDNEAQTGDESSAVGSDDNLSWWQIVLGLGVGVAMIWMMAAGTGTDTPSAIQKTVKHLDKTSVSFLEIKECTWGGPRRFYRMDCTARVKANSQPSPYVEFTFYDSGNVQTHKVAINDYHDVPKGQWIKFWFLYNQSDEPARIKLRPINQ